MPINVCYVTVGRVVSQVGYYDTGENILDALLREYFVHMCYIILSKLHTLCWRLLTVT